MGGDAEYERLMADYVRASIARDTTCAVYMTSNSREIRETHRAYHLAAEAMGRARRALLRKYPQALDPP